MAPSSAQRFPDGFVWGAATAAYQIEGAVDADGRTPSIWDAFCAIPGAVAGGDTGERAVEHYHRMPDDVDLIALLGLPAYRFSVSWTRVMGDGDAVNARGLDFYDRLVDALTARGIEPWLTLYHWDLPQALEAKGGWAERDTAHRLADLTEVVATRLGDRVRHWVTLNEPFCSSFIGYAGGEHAPGRREPKAAVAAAHHLLLAHGLSTRTLRSVAPGSRVGIALNPTTILPRDPGNDDDRAAAVLVDGLRNRMFLDPLLRGAYPADMLTHLEPFGLADVVDDGDLDVIAAPLDLLGINYYDESVVSGRGDGPAGSTEGDDGGPGRHVVGSPWVGAEDVRFHSRGLPATTQGWEIRPDGLRDLLVRLHADYPGLPPVYVTENGAAFDDVVTVDGIHDTDRLDYVRGHLRALAAAIDAGVDVRGYFAWSLLDNFEWAWGYAKRFGIVHVDFDTQERTIKDSGHWYATVAASNAIPADGG
nr:GH1 family beta-glucosidase [Jiangella anatolica]